MPKPHIHLLLPPNQWMKPGFSWCLRYYATREGRSQPVTEILPHTTCPRCLALFEAAQADQGHPMRQYSQLDTLRKSVQLKTPATVAFYARFLVQETQEVTLCLMANTRFRLIHSEELFRGLLDQSLLHPREIFCAVMRQHAFGFVLVQNHPSGEPEPSEQKRETTRHLLKCSKLMQIPFLDHVIVARQGFYSLRERTNLWDRV